MNITNATRVIKPLMTVTCIAGMVIITVTSILLLYGFFGMMENYVRDISRETNQYFTQLTKSN